ncbi:MAG: HAD-IIIA family hydrolase, partial [Planctomycetes bacterium]|nr:HAD-IIIA family hydrolase [Planctomycetota bacterium]
RVEDFEWIPGTMDALQALRQAGFQLVVVTNQSGIAQGLLTEQDLARIHAFMREKLSAAGIELAGVYHCPHHPSLGEKPGPCPCRKPAPGLLLQAARDLDLDLKRCWMIGDSLRDLLAADAVDMPGILVRTGKGAEQEKRLKAHPELRGLVADDLAQAVELLFDSDRHH